MSRRRSLIGALILPLMVLLSCATGPPPYQPETPPPSDVGQTEAPAVGVPDSSVSEREVEDPVAERPTGDESAAERSRIVEAHLSSMSLRERVAQRFVTYIDGTMVDAHVNGDLRDQAPAGYILYPWNYESAEDVQSLTENLQRVSRWHSPGLGVLICADQEGGRVQAFRFPELAHLPPAYWMGVHRDPEFVEAAAYINAVQLRWLGVNMSLSPVLDLYAEPDSSIIGDRSFGSDPELAAEYAAAYVRGFARAKVIATAKHFPGHGVSAIDSHSRLPLVDLTWDELMTNHVVPFAAAIDSGVDVVMTAHILYSDLDPTYPATLSPVLIRGLLRRDLGFDGVVMSDGLEMGALAQNFPLDDTLRQAIRSGVDLILLYTRYELSDVVDCVLALVETGAVSEAEINAGTRRVLELKARYGLLHDPSVRRTSPGRRSSAGP